MAVMSDASTAARLLDAQVAWLVDRVTGDELPRLAEEVVDDLLALGDRLQVGEVAEPAAVRELVRAALTQVPASAAASTLVAVATDTAYDGPPRPVTLAEVVDRDHVESLLAELLAHPDAVGAFLDTIAESPLVAGFTTRFVGRILAEAVATNRAVAERIPGMGPLVSLGSSMAGRVVGAADKQFEALFGDTAGKGTTFAMRRLNKVVVETLRDPAAQDAVLQVFDLYADTPLGGRPRLGGRDDAHRVAGLAQEMAIHALASEPALALADALADGFLAVYADETLTALVTDLGVDRDTLVAHARSVVPPLLAAAVASGELGALLRKQLAPFWESPEVTAILEGRA